MRYSFKEIKQRCIDTPGTWQEVMKHGSITPDHLWIEIDAKTLENIFNGSMVYKVSNKSFDTIIPEAVAPIVVGDNRPIPFEDWPAWAKGLKLISTKEDKGIGDTIARTIGPLGGDAFKTWFPKITGKSCGCNERQETLNKRYPY